MDGNSWKRNFNCVDKGGLQGGCDPVPDCLNEALRKEQNAYFWELRVEGNMNCSQIEVFKCCL